MNKRIIYYITSILLSFWSIGCGSDDTPAIEEVLEADRGAILRTVEFRSSEFRVNDPSSFIDILIEEQDIEDGDLLDFVEVYVAFQDNTTTGSTDLSSSEILFDTIDAEEFTRTGPIIPPLGEDPIPQTVLSYTFEEIMEAIGLPLAAATCADQIWIRTELFLTDGRSFSVDDLSALIAGFGTFFSSSFCYTINIVEPLDTEAFTGTYFYESIQDGFFGPTYGPPRLVTINTTHSENVRVIDFNQDAAGNPILFEFSIVCDRVVPQKLQFPGPFFSCGFGDSVLIGPDDVTAPVNPDDDSVFEVWFVEGDDGFDGGCGFGTLPSRLRLTRQ